MRALYFDLSMGAAGDMLTAALLDLLDEPEDFVKEFNSLGIPKVEMRLEDGESRGIRGRRVHIIADGVEEGEVLPHSEGHQHHEHSTLNSIAEIVNGLALSDKVKGDILAVYSSIAEAEAKVHGRPVSEVHFHEVGALDAVADVTAVCMLMDRLGADAVYASPVHVGSGTVRCAHGVLPVPAPATAELLMGIPSYGGKVRGELCTPTGAALLRRFIKSFGSQPLMTVSGIGCGLGAKEFESPNCLRVFVGEVEDGKSGAVCEISCNLDDMTGEALGFVLELLLEQGALDAFTVPIGMKKSRPGVLLCCICRVEDKARMAGLVLRHTSTLGVRVNMLERFTLERKFETLVTPYGDVRIKSSGGRWKAEYEDLAQIARVENWAFAEAEEYVKRFYYGRKA